MQHIYLFSEVNLSAHVFKLFSIYFMIMLKLHGSGIVRKFVM